MSYINPEALDAPSDGVERAHLLRDGAEKDALAFMLEYRDMLFEYVVDRNSGEHFIFSRVRKDDRLQTTYGRTFLRDADRCIHGVLLGDHCHACPVCKCPNKINPPDMCV